MTITVYGIPNCDTVKRARAWLAGHTIAHQFHDFKKQGLPPDRLDAWLHAAGWQALLNRKGSSWRQLEETRRAAVNGPLPVRALMLEMPTLVKRPVVAWDDGSISVGFDAAAWARRLGVPG